jgi:plastocyanin
MRRILVVTAVAAATVPWSVPPAHAGGGCHEPISQGSTGSIVIEGVCFSPTVNRVAAGSTVSWRNVSGIEHNLAGASEEFGYHEFTGQQPVTIRFKAAGTYPYACTFHPGMTGVVIVGDGAPGKVTPAVQVVSPDPVPTPAPAESTPAATRDTVTVAESDGDGWTVHPAAASGAGAGVLSLGLLAGFGLARRRHASDL